MEIVLPGGDGAPEKKINLKWERHTDEVRLVFKGGDGLWYNLFKIKNTGDYFAADNGGSFGHGDTERICRLLDQK